MIRLATPDDGPALAAIYGPVVAQTTISFELEPPPAAEMSRRVAAILEHAPWLVDDEGGVRGYAYASKHRERAAYLWAVDAAVYVAAGHRGKGVGRRLYLKLFELLRLQGFVLVCAGVTQPNDASNRLHESVGFRPVGTYPGIGYKFGAWRDVRWSQLELGPRPAQPEPPVTAAAARAMWERSLRP